MNPHLSQVREIFDQVSDLPHADRSEALDRLCPDGAVRAEVESLLRSHDSQDLMSAPTIAAPSGPGLEGPGTVIGQYKLLQTIGEGGFGIVYMAEQERPVRRKVALKIIKLGMDTRQVIARFEAERQALAMMDHPNIARVLDAGATETGRPYFVMELVRGVPITEYCDTNKLSPRDRLDLFIQVCHAVQHAHQKGVIHRDIKPSNVLVTLHDGRPVPKVIDFGIAKATSQPLTDKTLFTEFRQFIGTPEYMSPEQAEMSGLDVDTRADIYSLGVLLYELLTGTTPFEASTLRGQALDKIQRIIRETDPPLPSTRVGTLTGSAARTAAVPSSAPSQVTTADDVAKHRRTDAASLGRLLKGDLDWIVMKSIEKDRTRRYETATALAADVVRYLSDQPVEAGPPSGIYRLRKFAKRNRVWLLTTGIAAGAFTLAFVGVVYGLLEARSGRAAAVTAQREAELARSQTQAALERARRESDRNRMINEYLQEAVSGRRAAGGEDVPLAAVLDDGRALFGGDHAAVASALTAWASTRRAVGDGAAAEQALREAGDMLARMHGPSDARVWSTRLRQAHAIADQPGREREAESLFRSCVDALRSSEGTASPDFAVAIESLTSHLLATGEAGREAEIAPLFQQTVESFEAAYGPLDRRTIQEMSQYGQWLALRGGKDAAGSMLRETLRRAEEASLEPDSTQFMAMNSLILMELSQNGDFAEAAKWYDRLVELGDRMGGEYTKGTPAMRLQIGGIWMRAGRRDLALDRARAFVAEMDRRSISLNWESAMRVELCIDWIAPAFEDDLELGRRVQMLRAAGADSLRGGLTTPPATSKHLAGVWLESHGFAGDAEPILARAAAMRREASPADQRALGESLAALGRARLALGRFQEAQASLREALSIAQAGEGERSSAAYVLQHQIARTMIGLGRLDDAAGLLAEWSPREGSDVEVVASHAAAMAALESARGG